MLDENGTAGATKWCGQRELAALLDTHAQLHWMVVINRLAVLEYSLE